uniref:DPH-type MB domain-containing protein n=1 Tax=Steinernema glaseri TaxID=37863 RepID=A0A1I7Z259_9BILA
MIAPEGTPSDDSNKDALPSLDWRQELNMAIQIDMHDEPNNDINREFEALSIRDDNEFEFLERFASLELPCLEDNEEQFQRNPANYLPEHLRMRCPSCQLPDIDDDSGDDFDGNRQLLNIIRRREFHESEFKERLALFGCESCKASVFE